MTPPSAPVIVVGFDHQPASLAALRTAAELADRLAATLHVVHGIDERDYPIDPDTDVELWDAHSQAALARLHECARDTLTGHNGTWSYQTRRGNPVRLLARTADEHNALMIVVGAHRHRSLSRLMRGSVSRTLPRRAHHPVLLVPDPMEG